MYLLRLAKVSLHTAFTVISQRVPGAVAHTRLAVTVAERLVAMAVAVTFLASDRGRGVAIATGQAEFAVGTI